MSRVRKDRRVLERLYVAGVPPRIIAEELKLNRRTLETWLSGNAVRVTKELHMRELARKIIAEESGRD